MAELNMNDRITAYELARRSGNKDALLITELMGMSNQMLLDLPQVACNSGQIHKHLLRDSYPKAESHGYNMGVGHAATQTREVTEGLMMMSIYSIVDLDLARDSGDANKVYNDEAEGFLIGLGLDQANKIIYASKAKVPYDIDGLATRIASLKDKHAVDAGIIGAIGTKPVTSIYITAMGKKQLHGLYASNHGSFGVKREDKGESQHDYGGGKLRPVHMDLFSAQFGIAIEHPDSVYRICNVPVAADDWGTTPDAKKANRAKLIEKILYAQKRLPQEAGTVSMYANVGVQEIIEQAGRDVQISIHSDKDPWGNPVSMVNGMRLRRMDVIKSDNSEKVA